MTNRAETAEATEATAENGADRAASPEDRTGPSKGVPTKETILEMRQVAGLTAGSVMGLHTGSFQFRESDKEVGFSLTVQAVDDVTVIPGSAKAIIDEIPVVDPTPLGSAVLNVGSACFTVRPPRPEPLPEARLAALIDARTPPKAIPVPEFIEGQPTVEQTSSSRFGSLFSKDEDEPEQPLDAQSWGFLESIRDIRSIVAERHRRLHPDPEELISRLDRLDPGLWDRTVEHPMFARFPIAYSTIPWDPRFDEPERIPESLHRAIREMSCLPWVPVTANLLYGPLGIVGSRPAVLACARNAVLGLACLSAPKDIEFSIVTAQGLVQDWDWTSALPNSLFPSERSNYCIAVADGMTHFDGAGMDPQSVKDNEMGLIVLEESVEDLPDYCGTILQLTPDGRCQVTNHLGEQILGTPIGVAAGFAASAAELIREAIGDEDVLDDPGREQGLHGIHDLVSSHAPATPDLDPADLDSNDTAPADATEADPTDSGPTDTDPTVAGPTDTDPTDAGPIDAAELLDELNPVDSPDNPPAHSPDDSPPV